MESLVSYFALVLWGISPTLTYTADEPHASEAGIPKPACNSDISRLSSGRTSIKMLPYELLSEIFQHTVKYDQPLRNPGAGAKDLLSLSHVSKSFRQIAVDDPRLWSSVVYINRISQTWLTLILSRTRFFPFQLAFNDDGTVSQTVQDLVAFSFHRVSALHVRVKDGQEGTLVKRLLLLAAPSLKRCFIKFRGQRNVHLDIFIPNNTLPFHHHAPLLRTIHLVNCYVCPAILTSLPAITTVAIQYHGDQNDPYHTFLTCRKLGMWRPNLSSIQHLYLMDCVQFETGAFESVILPSLQNLVLSSSVEVCHQLSTALQFPSTCSVTIILTFPANESVEMDYSTLVAEAASSFVNVNIAFRSCALLLDNDDCPILRLSQHDSTGCVELRFDLRNLQVRLSRYRRCIIKITSLLLSPIHDTNIADHFMSGVWSHISTMLRTVLQKPRVLQLRFGRRSNAPHSVGSVVRALTGVQSTTLHAVDAWENRCLRPLLAYKNVPNMTQLTMRMGEHTMDPEAVYNLQEFIKARSEVTLIQFAFPKSQVADLGHAGVQEIGGLLGGYVKDFPGGVNVEWVEF